MAKPPGRRVPSDDLVVEIDGVEYHPHEGEYVEVVPSYYTPDDLRHALAFDKLMDDFAAIGDDEPEAMAEWSKRCEKISADLAGSIESRILSWSWTDPKGRALPEPTAAVIAALSWRELKYLERVVQGKDDPKNAGRPSQTTSSATGSPAKNRA